MTASRRVYRVFIVVARTLVASGWAPTALPQATLDGMGDGGVYLGDRAGGGDTITARTGLIQNYQPTPDLLVSAQGDYTRQRDLFSTLGIDHSVTTLNPTGVGLAPVPNALT